MRRLSSSVLFLAAIVVAVPGATSAQTVPTQVKTPNAEAVSAAYKFAEGVFAKLKEGKTEEIAKTIIEHVGRAWDASTRLKNTNEFKSKLDMIAISPPEGAYGKLSGFDLIEETSLPGSDRYFRLTYISYHEGAPLMWEFRFYVKPDGKVAVNSCAWSDDNPFEYLSTADKQLSRWYAP